MNFNDMVKSNRQNIRNIIRLITKESNEDLEQEVYLKALEHSENYKEKGSFKSWIAKIAKNVSKDYVKSKNKNYIDIETIENSISDIKTDEKYSPESKLLNQFRQKRIVSAINSLKPRHKQIILLAEIDGLSYEEISKVVNCPVGTVKSRLYNAKKNLAELLQDLL